jgi:preprotein translocase subunit Sss1
MMPLIDMFKVLVAIAVVLFIGLVAYLIYIMRGTLKR